MPDHIVFIGPRGVDVTSVGKSVAEKLKLPIYSIDDFTEQDWLALGFERTAYTMAFAHGGAYAAYHLLKPVRLRSVEKLLSHNERGVIILQPDFAVQEEPEMLAKLAALFAHVPHAYLLTPSADMQEIETLLDADLRDFPDFGEVNAYWVRQPCNERLAKHIVYTKGKTEEDTRDEILQLRRETQPSDIILIGPKLTGKTTVGHLLSVALGLPQVSLDEIGERYLGETDYEPDAASQVWKDEGIFGLLRYREPYSAHMVERALQDERNCVIDFGGGHSIYEDEALFQRVQNALAPYPNVVLIMPAPDQDESIRILKERFEADVASERRLQRLLVTHPSYHQLAKQVVHTKNKTVDEMSDEILQRLNHGGTQ